MLRALRERALELVREVDDGKEGRADGEDGGGGDPFLVIVLLCSAREILKCNFNWSEI